MTDRTDDIMKLIMNNFIWTLGDDALERMIEKNFVTADDKLVESIENYIMENQTGRKKNFSTEVCKGIKGLKAKIINVTYGSEEVDWIVDEMLHTVEHQIQWKILRLALENIHKSERHLNKPLPEHQRQSFNDSVKDFTLQKDGSVILDITQQANIVKILKSVLDDQQWCNLPHDTFFWYSQSDGYYKHVVISLVLCNYLYDMGNWGKSILDILTDFDRLNSLIIKVYNDNNIFKMEFGKRMNAELERAVV